MENKKPEHTPMSIYLPKGTKVIFKASGGFLGELKDIKKILKEEQVYTIADIRIWGWRTDVYLEEKPGILFNSVMFEEKTE